MKACTVTSLTEKQFLKTPPKAICEQIQKNKNTKTNKNEKYRGANDKKEHCWQKSVLTTKGSLKGRLPY